MSLVPGSSYVGIQTAIHFNNLLDERLIILLRFFLKGIHLIFQVVKALLHFSNFYCYLIKDISTLSDSLIQNNNSLIQHAHFLF